MSLLQEATQRYSMLAVRVPDTCVEAVASALREGRLEDAVRDADVVVRRAGGGESVTLEILTAAGATTAYPEQRPAV